MTLAERMSVCQRRKQHSHINKIMLVDQRQTKASEKDRMKYKPTIENEIETTK